MTGSVGLKVNSGFSASSCSARNQRQDINSAAATDLEMESGGLPASGYDAYIACYMLKFNY